MASPHPFQPAKAASNSNSRLTSRPAASGHQTPSKPRRIGQPDSEHGTVAAINRFHETPAAPSKRSPTLPPPPGHAPPTFYDLSICPVRNGLDGIMGKWPLLIITHLSFGTHRYNELRGALPDISQRMLTKTLKTLVEKGLVERVQHRTMPPQVDYSLTPDGDTLLPLVEPLLHWGLRQKTKAR